METALLEIDAMTHVRDL